MTKKVLKVFPVIKSGNMSANITGATTNIEFLDNIGIQLNFTGTPTGTFNIQISADYQEINGTVTNQGNWINLVLSPSPAAAGSANTIYIDMTQLSAPWIRVIYTASSGTGTLNAFVVGKEI